jgi:outer membrane biosynthesis protein TonB
MRTAYAISGLGHAAVLLWSVWSISGKPLAVPPSQALPVDIVTASEFSQITAGALNAPKVETPKPLVEKVEEKKPVEDPTAKVVEKKEVTAAREAAPPPEPKPVEPKAQDKKPAEEAKPEAIAEALSKEAANKPEPKKVEARTPVPPRKPPPPPAPKFDANQVQALLNKRDPTRLAAAGETLHSTAALGVSSGRASQLSMSALDALRARLGQLWNPPAGAQNPEELVVLIRVKFKPDGTLAGQPLVLTSGKTTLFMAARDSAVRALFRGQPFDMLKPEHYEQWKEIEINFDPRYMIRG